MLCVLAQPVLCADLQAGKVVWWGMDVIRRTAYSGYTNGVIESSREILTNAVAVTAGHGTTLVLKSDGTVFACGEHFYGGNDVPTGLSNVSSIAVEGSSCWAIRHDGSVARWGNDEDDANIVAGLTNIKAITWAGYRSYLALKKNGILVGMRFDQVSPVLPVKASGQILNNIVGIASMSYTPLVLKRDGTVLRLGFQTPGAPPAEPVVSFIDESTLVIDLGGESRKTPYEYTSADPVNVGGTIMSNVIALASGGGHALALKSNGTVVAWGDNDYGEATVPAGLSNITAIAAGSRLSLALKRDGTVVAWGDNHYGQASVPAGLRNVIAIAAGGDFSMAITTGAIPSSVYIQPHGRLEEMASKADLVFKGRAISSAAITNASFPSWGKPHATLLNVISVLKGSVSTNVLVFQHNTSGPNAWSGGTPPPHYVFEAAQSYLVFAEKTERRDVFRQLSPMLRSESDGVTRTLDARGLAPVSVKEAHWLEINRLLTDDHPSNALYAIQQLDLLSKACGRYDDWPHTDDFKREAVLKVLLPLTTNSNDAVAVAAIRGFGIGAECAAKVKPYAAALIQIADGASSVSRRVSAIATFSGTRSSSVSNVLARWLRDPDHDVRAQAVSLLPDFPGGFSEQALRERAGDPSPKVRAAVADAIGNGRIERLLPTLANLFLDLVGRERPVGPLTTEQLEGGARIVGVNGGVTMVDDLHFPGVNVGDVHTSAGFALLKFDVDQVSDILKTNLNDGGFRLNFLCKLAEKGAGPWLDEMAEVMEARRTRNEKKAETSGNEPKASYLQSLMALSGTYFQCWNTIYNHLHALPKEEFRDGKLDRYLNLLENAGNTGSQEPIKLYELYRLKGLEKRAAEFRNKCEKAFSYDMSNYFNRVDGQFTIPPVKPDQ